MRFHVTPIYGNGWTDGADTIFTPDSFDVQGEQSGDCLVGTVESSNALDGAQFRATPRHTTSDGVYNCELALPDRQSLNGYCLIKAA